MTSRRCIVLEEGVRELLELHHYTVRIIPVGTLTIPRRSISWHHADLARRGISGSKKYPGNKGRSSLLKHGAGMTL